jgi:NitT/TauT family transport system substrate-binding protein
MRAILIAILVLCAAPALAQTKLKVGTNPTLSDGPLHIAVEKGYAKDAGLEVEIVDFPSPQTMIALAATGDLPVVGTAVAASYFNSLAQGMPLKIIADRAQHPVFHNLMVRTDLKDTIKKPADLKGRTVGLSARGSMFEYETGRVLESVGLMPFADVGPALQNKAVEVAVSLPPFVELLESRGLAVRWLDPAAVIQKVQISGWIVNTDWAAKNGPTLDSFMAAWLRGARDYHRAQHGGPNRAEVVEILARRTPIKDPAMYDRMKWISVNPNGEVFAESLLDAQDFFLRNGLIQKKFTAEELLDMRYVNAALQKVGRYTP